MPIGIVSTQLDKQIQETYAQASTATNKTSLYDPYVKAIFWALDRIEGEGLSHS